MYHSKVNVANTAEFFLENLCVGKIEFIFLVFNSSWTGVFVKLKPPLKISRSATALDFFEKIMINMINMIEVSGEGRACIPEITNAK